MSNLYPLFVALAPLLAAILTALPPRFVTGINFKVGWWLFIAGFASSIPVLWQSVQSAEPIRVVLFSSHWAFLPLVELSVDRLAATMMVVISSIGMLLYRYSTRYLQQDPGHARYQTLLALAISTLLFMVSSADLVTLFVTWQLLSWFLSLLSHNYAHGPTAQSTFRTFIMLRVGDIAFLSGIVLAYHLYGTVHFTQLFELARVDQTHFSLLGTGLEISAATVITMLIFVGAMSKSAQFPLHMWLPDSLYAPTPVHALLHAGIINAGGFLLNRLSPLYILSPTTLHLVLSVGLATMIFGKCMMLVKNDIKKTLGYSTIGQMGYMIMECGLGAFSLAVFHLIAHGLFKATVFLNCGNIIHKARLEPEHPPMPSHDPGPGIVGWIAGFLVSFFLPLVIISGAHYALGISILNPQGVLIFLLFSWVTSAHAILTLFRLNKGWPMMVGMLMAVAFVSTAYFFAAEQFTHFLYPDHAFVSACFDAAVLPNIVYIVLAALLFLSILSSWSMLYLHYHDKIAIRSGRLWAELYLIFINRLYLDGFALRMFSSFKGFGRVIDRSRYALPALALMGAGCAVMGSPPLSGDSIAAVPLLILAALALPLFPLHGLYLTAVTRAPGLWAILLSLLLPTVGTLIILMLPSELMHIAGVLAAFGAIWGAVKALMQVRVPQLLSYFGISLYSVLWWHIAQVGKVTQQAILYTVAVTLVIGGLNFAWDRIRVRYGDLDLNQIGGLFRPMPRFSLCLALLVMAAVGLPPFALFFSFLGMLLSPSTSMSFGLVAVIVAWFAASWYLFKLMQQLLFGPYRKDIRYEDIGLFEIAVFAIIIILLIVPISIPQLWIEPGAIEVTWTDRGIS